MLGRSCFPRLGRSRRSRSQDSPNQRWSLLAWVGKSKSWRSNLVFHFRICTLQWSMRACRIFGRRGICKCWVNANAKYLQWNTDKLDWVKAKENCCKEECTNFKTKPGLGRHFRKWWNHNTVLNPRLICSAVAFLVDHQQWTDEHVDHTLYHQ